MDDVKIYPPPGEEDASEDYDVSVNGESVFVYKARVSAVPHNQVWPGYQRPLNQTEMASFAYWDMSGPVTVEVESKRPFERVDIRPTSYGKEPFVEGRVRECHQTTANPFTLYSSAQLKTEP